MAKSRPLLSFQVGEYFQLTDTVLLCPLWNTVCCIFAILLTTPIYTFYNPSFKLLPLSPLSCPFWGLPSLKPYSHSLWGRKNSNSPFQLSICVEDNGGVEPSKITLLTVCSKVLGLQQTWPWVWSTWSH